MENVYYGKIMHGLQCLFWHQNKLMLICYNTCEQDLARGTKKDKTSVWKSPYNSKMNSAEIEARRNIQFTVKLGLKNGKVIGALQKACGDNALRKSEVYK